MHRPFISPSISYPFRHQPQTHIVFNPPIPQSPSSPQVGLSTCHPPRFVGLSTTVLPPGGINEHRSPAAGPPSRQRAAKNHGSESRSLRPSNPGAVPYFLQSQAVGLVPECHHGGKERRDGEGGHWKFGSAPLLMGRYYPRFPFCGPLPAVIHSNRVAI